LAVAVRGGLVVVVDTTSGEIIGHVDGQGKSAEVGWLAAKGEETPLLLVATGQSLNAFRVAPE
jgi:hypothetical protein